MHRIMIVDDSDTFRSQLSKLLVTSGFEVIEAVNGMQGVEVFQKNSNGIKLLITDFNMPEMDGIAMLRKIRNLPGGKDVPVFMLTTESSLELKATGKELGVRAWVTKPYSEEKIVIAIKKVIGL